MKLVHVGFADQHPGVSFACHVPGSVDSCTQCPVGRIDGEQTFICFEERLLFNVTTVYPVITRDYACSQGLAQNPC